MKHLLYALPLVVLLTSCFVNRPAYYLSGANREFQKEAVQKNWLVIFNNFSSSAEQEVKSQIIIDFKTALSGKTEFQSDFLNFDNEAAAGKLLTAEEIAEIEAESAADYVAVFSVQMKYQTSDKTIEIRKEKVEKYRNMFVFLNVYDAKTKDNIYSKYAVSQLKTGDSADLPVQTGIKTQALKTYEKLKKDFFKVLTAGK